MSLSLAQRRQTERKAPALAAIMAACCSNFLKHGAKPVTYSLAVAALTRAFRLLIEAGGKSVVVPMLEAEALGVPERKADHLPGQVTWLAVGLDVQGRGSNALHSAQSQSRPVAHEAARSFALARLTEVCAYPGFRDCRKARTVMLETNPP